MSKPKMLPSVQREIRACNLDELYALFRECIGNTKIHKDDKPVLLAYIEMRIKKLQKKADYEDTEMSDSAYIKKWGSK